MVLLAENQALSYEGWLLFFKGTWVGIAVTAPPGPVGGLAVKRTINDGLAFGVATALGACFADVTLGIVAMVPSSQFRGLAPPWDRVAAGVIVVLLLFLGIRHFRKAMRGVVYEKTAPDVRKGRGVLGLLAGAYLLTLMTPATVPFFIATFTQLELGSGAAQTQQGPLLVIGGVASGAAAWWALVCGLTHRYRDHAKLWEVRLEYVCAALMWVGAGVALWKGILKDVIG
ncbi:MAG: hypothetical protein HMLKMBBP_01868 [Planctomycetes bacterium]|nr:hypothetical protein [Planctomycetota bacterium]